MRLSRAVKVGTVACFAVAVMVIGAAKSLDTARIKAFLTVQVKAATGRDLTIAGALRLKVGLVPVLIAEGVSLANRPGGSRTEMIRVDRVEAELALLPLLKREIRVVRVIVSAPDILLETDRHGNGNWIPSATAVGPGTEKAPPTRFNLRELKVKNARVTLRDGSTGLSQSINLHKLAIQPERPGAGPMNVQVLGDHQGRNFEITGTLGSLATVSPERPWPIQLKASGRGLQAALNGSVADPFSGSGQDLRLTAQGDEIADLARFRGLHLQPMGPFRLSARLTDPGGRVAFSDIDIAAGRRDSVFVSGKGTIRDAGALAGLDLILTAETDNLAGMSRLVGRDIPSMGPVRVSGHLRGGSGDWRLSDLKAAVAGSDLNGEISLTLGTRPHLVAQLSTTSLYSTDFTSPALRAGEKLEVRPTPKPADGRLVPALALPVDLLDSFDGDLTAHFGTLTLGTVRLVDASIGLHLDKGRIVVAPLRAGVAGGALTGSGELRVRGAIPEASLSIEGHQIDLARLAGESGFSEGVAGRADLKLGLQGRGGDLRTLLQDSRGNLAARVNAASPLDGGADMRCAVARFTVQGGVARSERGLGAEFETHDLLGGGSIDLRSEQVEVHLLPFGRSGGEAVDIGGTLAEPVVVRQMVAGGIAADGTACQTAWAGGQGKPPRPARGRPSR
jgi:uncharacterized protein involved in outer membrane biogenesis